MPKVFNYTDRTNIPKECLHSRALLLQGDEAYLELGWDFSILELPADSLVSTEISAIGTFQTDFIDHGALGDGVLLPKKFSVSKMRNPDLIKFRVKITRKNEEGLPIILAEIDKVTPILEKHSENGSSLLKRRKISNLLVPWELRFEQGVPVLCISDQRGLWFQLLKKSPWFDPTILATIVRTVFIWSIEVKSNPEDEDIFKQWKEYFLGLGCPEEFYERKFDPVELFSEEGNEILSMANTVSANFSKNFGLLETLSDPSNTEVYAR